MNELDQLLKAALLREPAPQGFADRVLMKARPRSRSVSWWRLSWVRWSIASALALMSWVGGLVMHERQERRRGQQAREQVLLALRITANKLRTVQEIIKTKDQRGNDR